MKSFIRFSMLFMLTLPIVLLAQNPSKVTIKGVVRDSTNAEAGYATVMLLNIKDSTLVNFTTTNDKGVFSFNSVRNIPYLLKISHISYIPHQQALQPSANEVNDLGVIIMKPISQALMEVVIKAAKAPLRIRGDTIEYDATTFKVPPGSTVEDLLRRLPGIDIDADGNISTQGKDVKRVYVDGKTFFGDDPKSVTKNLDAEAISKVQVFDEKSEQTKLTGVDDGTKEKAMNLGLKDEYKKGSFGKATLGGGTSERWAARASYNRFNDKNQLSFLGYGNNINQTGVNWEDYGEFKGQNTFNDYDNGDFGFGGGRGYYIISDGGMFMGSDRRGYSESYGAGVNYNFDNKKTKYNASYFYNQTSQDLDQYTSKETFLTEGSVLNNDTLSQSTFYGNHSIGTRLEHDIDSNNKIIAKANIKFSTNTNTNYQIQRFTNEDLSPINSLSTDNSTDLGSWSVGTAAIYRHRFLKAGRSFALSAGYNTSHNSTTDSLLSINKFFTATTFTEQIRQLKDRATDAAEIKSSALYTEPITKKWFWETFYNFSRSGNQANRQVKSLPEETRIDSVSVYSDNSTLYDRLGSSIRYSNNGFNAMAGVAIQQLKLKGSYLQDEGMPFVDSVPEIKRTYNNWVPNVNINYQLPNNMYLSFDYSYSVEEPSVSDLAPIPNSSNRNFLVEGNPNLEPARSHSVSFSYNYWNPASFANISLYSSASYSENQIVYNQWIKTVEGIGLQTITRPDNISGGKDLNVGLWSNLPIIKTKFSVGANGNFTIGKSASFVNDIRNDNTNTGIDFGLNFDITPSTKFILDLRGSLGFNKISYSIQKDQNQNIQNHSAYASLKWQFMKKTFLESSFNYTVYINDRWDFDRRVPIWNASVRRIIGEKNRFEVRLAAFDIFNKRVSISQTANSNYVLQSVAPTLARYFMLSLSYNIRGYEDKLSKNRMF
jgi:outer membrane receptor protein involved in Fe transport